MDRTLTGPVATALEATAVALLATAACDALGLRSAAFLFLVLAIPATAAAALAAYGRVVDRDRGRVQATLATVLLLTVLVGTAVRSPALADGDVPPLATVALAAAFVLFVAQALVVLVEPSRA